MMRSKYFLYSEEDSMNFELIYIYIYIYKVGVRKKPIKSRKLEKK
jgi:hypothetical protein